MWGGGGFSQAGLHRRRFSAPPQTLWTRSRLGPRWPTATADPWLSTPPNERASGRFAPSREVARARQPQNRCHRGPMRLPARDRDVGTTRTTSARAPERQAGALGLQAAVLWTVPSPRGSREGLPAHASKSIAAAALLPVHGFNMNVA